MVHPNELRKCIIEIDGVWHELSQQQRYLAEITNQIHGHAHAHMSIDIIEQQNERLRQECADVRELMQEIREKYPTKTIWMYTGYTWESIQAFDPRRAIVNQVDVLVDGPFIKNLLDVNYPWAGSTNQRVILVQDTLNDNGNLHLWQKEYN